MTIEEEIFKNEKINFNKLIKYGFKKENNLYFYSQNILNNTFRVDIYIDDKEIVKGKIYDLTFKEEYFNFRIKDFTGSFIEQVREKYIKILEDIKNKCSIKEQFKFNQTNRIVEQIKKVYKDEPEFKWIKFPNYAIFRNFFSQKWYSVIMNIPKNKIGLNSEEEIEIINLKLNPEKIKDLLKQKGFYPAYHMNKKNWLTITLDNTLTDDDLMKLINQSYNLTIK